MLLTFYARDAAKAAKASFYHSPYLFIVLADLCRFNCEILLFAIPEKRMSDNLLSILKLCVYACISICIAFVRAKTLNDLYARCVPYQTIHTILAPTQCSKRAPVSYSLAPDCRSGHDGFLVEASHSSQNLGIH
jgi:hypothetical protein